VGEFVGVINGITAHTFAFVKQNIKERPAVATINLNRTAVIVDLYRMGEREFAGIIVG
jgi:hypothetical protein